MSVSTVNNIHDKTIARREQHIEYLRKKIANLTEELENEIDYLNSLKKCSHNIIPLEATQ